MSNICSIIAPENLLVGKLLLKSSSKVLHLLDNPPGTALRAVEGFNTTKAECLPKADRIRKFLPFEEKPAG